ncbi:hypothetical protein TNCT_15481 [Trichonephila clavata]|uniref:Uncharacterized protein n=1 Tax=Trichonephila clavata TaxID=2740835 RepID=A0A8X6GZ10_TRICU|nr:hypothetical protein TNCT_15481 [Trichonephila clavata]
MTHLSTVPFHHTRSNHISQPDRRPPPIDPHSPKPEHLPKTSTHPTSGCTPPQRTDPSHLSPIELQTQPQ